VAGLHASIVARGWPARFAAPGHLLDMAHSGQ
jgi:hypothetical protein